MDKAQTMNGGIYGRLPGQYCARPSGNILEGYILYEHILFLLVETNCFKGGVS